MCEYEINPFSSFHAPPGLGMKQVIRGNPALYVSEPVRAFICIDAGAARCSRARGKSILYTQHVLSLFGLSAATSNYKRVGDAIHSQAQGPSGTAAGDWTACVCGCK